MTTLHRLTPGLVILLICGFLLYVTTQFEEDLLGMSQGMSATLVPRLILGIIAALTVVMMIGDAQSSDTIEAPHWKVAATAAILATAAALMSILGVLIVFAGVCVLIPLLWGARNLLGIAVFAVAIPAAIYVVFQLLLAVRLPLGPLAGFGL